VQRKGGADGGWQEYNKGHGQSKQLKKGYIPATGDMCDSTVVRRFEEVCKVYFSLTQNLLSRRRSESAYISSNFFTKSQRRGSHVQAFHIYRHRSFFVPTLGRRHAPVMLRVHLDARIG
jgi:hypothetical protein